MASTRGHRLSLLAILTAAASTAACAGDSAVSGGPCATNLQCPANEQCVSGTCIPATRIGCKTDEACGIGETCDRSSGMCMKLQVTGCNDDGACPPNQKCNTLTGVCVAGNRACTMEAQCMSIGRHCNVSTQQCVECLERPHCPPGKECTNNVCVDGSINPNPNPNPNPTSCSGDAQCSAPSTVCEGGTCVAGCGQIGSPVRCASGTVCNSNTGRCVPGMTTCSSDPECGGAPRRVCENQQCVPGCTELGGIQCTGGNVCNTTTGRCEAPSGCTRDAQCGAPAAICVNSACVPGCGRAGGMTCTGSTVCDTNTGRCVMVTPPCQSDASCSPPNTVCEGGQCVPGCGAVGGIQCTGATMCSATTGRCTPGMAGCTTDAQCGPPAMVCDRNTGSCVPGCPTRPCGANATCNTATGQCSGTGPGPGPGPGTGQLDATCTTNGDCASAVCFDFEGLAPGDGLGSKCVSTCGGDSDCPAGFTCYNGNGAKMCLGTSLFGGATFSRQAGQVCTGGGQCHSNYCPELQCVPTCSDSSDCGGRGSCGWSSAGLGRWVAACDGPVGARPNGQSCSGAGDCQSGACLNIGTQAQPNLRCLGLCASSAQCAANEVCTHADYTDCTQSVGPLCLSYAINLVKVCAPVAHGNDPVGAPCTLQTAQSCRSHLCHGQLGQCTDVCSTDADCPSTHRCKVESYGALPDGTQAFVNVCLPL